MSTIFYGNLSIGIVDDLGASIDRAGALPAVTDMLRPGRAEVPQAPPMLGRKLELADAFGAIAAGRPVEFHAACGYGKTTLLRQILAAADARGIAPNCRYARMDSDRVEDLLHQLVAKLFTSARPIKLTQDQCAQVLGRVSGIIAIDDVSAGPDAVGYLLDVLHGCDLVLGAARPVLGRRGTSRVLAGLPDETALGLVADRLGRPLRDEELPAARRLVDAVDGQPLHLRQAAALVRDGGHSLESLAEHAQDDPDSLDRLSINGLAEVQRRALAALALVAGALVTPDVVDAIDNIADLGECLDSLHRRGLIERQGDRYGLPVCKTSGYRQMLLKYLGLAAAARALCTLLAAPSPPATESGSAADAALSVIEFAADQGDWETVAKLAKAAEAILFLAGRWEAWKHALGRGLDAAKALGDGPAEAFFSHQLGSLAFCRDELDDAFRLLRHALALRERLGDRDGADRTRHNLELLQAPAPPAPPQARAGRHRLPALAGLAGAVVLVAGTVAIASTLHGSSSTQHANTVRTVTAPASVRVTPTTPASVTVTPTVVTPTTPTPVTVPPSTPIVTPVTLDNVVTDTQDVATRMLRDQGLTVTPVTTTDCTAGQSGTVTAQSPVGGASVESGSTVTITVCAASPDVTVANVIGQSQSAATTTLQDQGFTVSPLTTTDCSTADNGTVTVQSPVGGSPAESGSTVSITVCANDLT